ncbi:vWA domain-containing protein [Clostridium vincentii]|uniref:VWFA domain-containing protein n=1 Tax=Clostridium vincentii TaxID=52704 RepID=A0A2T0B8Z3_9CLOT|nr:vWA domain-containing protein [Clostridium vincentii]PRR80366.1 hypothetical protein CLVI_30530 [Clostridium vincentii]
MKKNLTELVFIIDRSGSMAGLEDDTMGGYNAVITKQKKEDGEANVTTILFDDQVETLHERISIQDIKQMTENEYYVRGCTALLDAIGETISYMGNVQKYAKSEERANKVLFIITTDGYENSSKEYSYDKVKGLIDRQKTRYDWEFLFLGANIDAISTAERFGISKEFATNYVPDKRGTKLNYEAMNVAISCCRAEMPLDKSWKEEVERDYKSRNKKH